MMENNLRRWGVTAGAIFAAGWIGCCMAQDHGPLNDRATQRADSARIANAAADATHLAEARRFAAWRQVMATRMDSLLSAHGQDTGITNARISAVRATIIRVTETTQDPALQVLADTLHERVARLEQAVQQERAGGDAALRTASALLRADTVEFQRRDGVEVTLRAQRDSAGAREGRLAQDNARMTRQLAGWSLAVTVGPGAGLEVAERLRFAVQPVSVTLGLSRRLRLPRLLPW